MRLRTATETSPLCSTVSALVRTPWFSALTRVNLKLSPILKLRFNYVIVSIGAIEVHQQNQSRHVEVKASLLVLSDSTKLQVNMESGPQVRPNREFERIRAVKDASAPPSVSLY